MADTGRLDKRLIEEDESGHIQSRKKWKQHIVRNTFAFLSTLIIVAIVLQCIPSGKVRVSLGKPHADNIYENQTHRIVDLEKEYFRPNRRRNKILSDDMWTRGPDIPLSDPKLTNVVKEEIRESNSLEARVDTKVAVKNKITSKNKNKPSHSANGKLDNSKGPHTTPSVTEGPTTPVTTSSDTTPLYTEAPTTPITTASVTTPITTAPGGDPFITTESDPSIEDDPNETMKLIRIRRQVNNGATPTSEDPRSTTTAGPPADCPNSAYAYRGPDGTCQCGRARNGRNCEQVMTESAQESQLEKSVEFTTEAEGEYTDSDRAAFQEQLEAQYSSTDAFMRVFVLEPEYDSATGKTSLSYIVFYNKQPQPIDLHASAGITSRVVAHNLPILINGQAVVFGPNKTAMVTQTPDGQTEVVPLSAATEREVCYIYEQIDACGSKENRGQCVDKDGQPACICFQMQYVGEFCDEQIEYIDDSLLTVLLPILAALGVAVLFCSCCFYFCLRRANKGKDIATESYTESVQSDHFPALILPRYYRPNKQWKEFIPGPVQEEVYETYSNRSFYEQPEIEVQPVVIDRPVIVERPVYIDRPVILQEVEEVEEVERPTYPYNPMLVNGSELSNRSTRNPLQRMI